MKIDKDGLLCVAAENNDCETIRLLTSTVHAHNQLIYKETQKYLGTINAQIFKGYINQYSWGLSVNSKSV